jgi:hypothetical protein
MSTVEYFKQITKSLSDIHSRALELGMPMTESFQKALDKSVEETSRKMFLLLTPSAALGAGLYIAMDTYSDTGFWWKLALALVITVTACFYLTGKSYEKACKRNIGDIVDEDVCKDLWRLPEYHEEVEAIFSRLREVAAYLDYMNMHARFIDNHQHPHALLSSVLYYLDKYSDPGPDNLYHVATISQTIDFFINYIDEAAEDININARPMIPLIQDMPSGPDFLEGYQIVMGLMFDRMAYLHDDSFSAKTDKSQELPELLPSNVIPLFANNPSQDNHEDFLGLHQDFMSLVEFVDPIFNHKGPVLIGDSGFDKCLSDATSYLNHIHDENEVADPA